MKFWEKWETETCTELWLNAWIKQENKESWDTAVKNHNERNRVQQREEGDKNVLENQSKKPEGDKWLLGKWGKYKWGRELWSKWGTEQEEDKDPLRGTAVYEGG